MYVALPMRMGAWSMACVLRQQIELLMNIEYLLLTIDEDGDVLKSQHKFLKHTTQSHMNTNRVTTSMMLVMSTMPTIITALPLHSCLKILQSFLQYKDSVKLSTLHVI